MSRKKVQNKMINNEIHKFCNDCKKWFPLTSEYFYKSKRSSDGYSTYCKKDTIERSSNYQKNHPERTKRYTKEYYIKKPQYVKDKYTRWLKNNKERAKKSQKEWQRNNPDKVSEYNRERNMHKSHEISNEEWENCKNYFNYRCAYCGIPIEEHYITYKGITKLGDFHKEHVDHNGANDLSNCVPACKSCNTSKHTYKLNEWYNESIPIFTIERFYKIKQWLNSDYTKYIKTK